jgi:ABC-type transport system substrate-binding protein
MPQIVRVGVLTPHKPSVDPRQALDFANVVIPLHIYESPYRPAPEGGIVEPVLLEAPLQVDPGGRNAAFSAAVRRDRKFSDGTPVTAAAIADSLSATPSFVQEATVEATGDRLHFRLRHPNARFDLTLANLNLPVVKKTPTGYVTTGPFMYAPDSRSDLVRLVRNPFYGGTVYPDEIHVRVYPADPDGRPSALMEAVQKREVDFTDYLSREQTNEVSGVQKILVPGFCTSVLFFNTERIQDARVRRALAANVDRLALASALYTNPVAYAASSLLPPVLGRLRDGFMFAPERVAASLREAGFTAPAQPWSMLLPAVPRPYLPKPLVIAEKLAERCAAVGIPVRLDPARDMAEFSRKAEAGTYDLALWGWIPDTPDRVDYLQALLASPWVPRPGHSAAYCGNLARFRNLAMDAALTSYRSERREETLTDVHRILQEEAPLLPLLYGARVAVMSWRFTSRPASFEWRPFLAETPLKKD